MAPTSNQIYGWMITWLTVQRNPEYPIYQQSHTEMSNKNAYSLSSGGSDGIHDGVHVQVALTGGGGADTHRFICHLYVNLHTCKHRKLNPNVISTVEER